MEKQPPDVESALFATRDYIRKFGLDGPGALGKAAEDWDVKPDVLRIRFVKAFNQTPEQMAASRPPRRTERRTDNAGIRTDAAQKTPSPIHRKIPADPEGIDNKIYSDRLHIMQAPDPICFGLSGREDMDIAKNICQNTEKNSKKFSFFISVFISVFLFAFFNISFYIIIFIIFALSIYINEFIVAYICRNPEVAAAFTMRDNEQRYLSALDEWKLTCTEVGERYWRQLKGAPFEKAVAQMFLRRGCAATLTKGSGDGGIDIFLTIGSAKYGCQCKGHAKPIGVKTIRETVGSCKRHIAIPVVFATNGFTKPALKEAHDLGVHCLDARDLCRLARKENITALI